MKRKLSFLLAFVFLASAFGLTVSAPTAQAFHGTFPCDDSGLHKVFANINNPGGAADVSGVSFELDISGTSDANSFFGTCYQGGTEVAAYERLVSKTVSNASLTFGITRCYDDEIQDWGADICMSPVSEAEPRYFIAAEGCGGGSLLLDLPIHPGYGPHTLIIRKSASNPVYQFLVDGVNYRQINLSDSHISCWINGNKGVSFAGESFEDGSIVGSSTAYTFMETLRARPAGGSFTTVTPTGCFTSLQPDDHPFNCTWGTGYFQIWNTWQ